MNQSVCACLDFSPRVKPNGSVATDYVGLPVKTTSGYQRVHAHCTMHIVMPTFLGFLSVNPSTGEPLEECLELLLQVLADQVVKVAL